MYLSDNKKELFFSELYSLLSSGLELSRSFEMLIEGEKENKNALLLKNLYTGIVKGSQMYMAMKNSGAFSPIDYGVVKIGEETGRLNDILLFLCNYYNKKEAQRRMVKNAVSYPIIILITSILVIAFMIRVIVPMFKQVYNRVGGELPDITQYVLYLSEKFPVFAVVFAVTAICVCSWIYLTGDTEQTQKIISGFVLKIPYIKDIVKKNVLISVCKLLSLLIMSGIPLMYSIILLAEIIRFYPYRISFDKIAKDLEKGVPFSDTLIKYPQLYDKKFITLVRVGEESNKLHWMMKKIGDEFTAELEYKFKFASNIIEPVLILLVGALVALILISMYLPMFKLSGIMV